MLKILSNRLLEIEKKARSGEARVDTLQENVTSENADKPLEEGADE